MISAGSCSRSDYIVGVAGSGPVGLPYYKLHLHALQPYKAQESWQKSPDKVFPLLAGSGTKTTVMLLIISPNGVGAYMK